MVKVKNPFVEALQNIAERQDIGSFKKIFDLLGLNSNHIENSLKALRKVFLNKTSRFDRNWDSKERYSMDWYYPILAGIYDKSEAIKKINSKLILFCL